MLYEVITVKECPAHLDALELAVMETISNEPKVTFLGQHLILRASSYNFV